MRDAIGGMYVFQFMMVFIVMFSAIMAVGLNYATTFRVKNQIVDLLEKYETYDNAAVPIENYLSNIKYYDGGSDSLDTGISGCLNNSTTYCIMEAKGNNGGHYYIVTTYVVFDFPVIGRFIQSPVRGQTSTIKNFEEIRDL